MSSRQLVLYLLVQIVPLFERLTNRPRSGPESPCLPLDAAGAME